MTMRWLLLLLLLLPARARADEVAPELERADLRARAEIERKKLPAVVGLYVAFDDDASDPIAMAACDDDGDPVVLLSDALLRLAWNVAIATSYDEDRPARHVEAYATFLARAQLPGRRLLPPPPGAFIAARPAPTRDRRFHEILAFVVAREIAHVRAGDLACPKPTPTREAGDDVWTAGEKRAAEETARRLYPGRGLERDREAITAVLEAGGDATGALAWLRFLTQLEVDRVAAIARFDPSYVKHHPASAARLAMVKGVADTWRKPR